MISATACLALAIFFESRNQPIVGQKAVANVVLNRIEGQRDICDVIYEPDQFSWAKRAKKGIAVKKAKKIDSKAWVNSMKVADKVLSEKKDVTRGAKFFNTVALGVRYRTGNRPIRIGNHIFY